MSVLRGFTKLSYRLSEANGDIRTGIPFVCAKGTARSTYFLKVTERYQFSHEKADFGHRLTLNRPKVARAVKSVNLRKDLLFFTKAQRLSQLPGRSE